MVEAALLSVTHEELLYLMGGLISYIWRQEERELTGPETGYADRKELLERLRQFEAENFPNITTAG